MTTNLFSTYRQGENRVTATFLAVLERLSLPNIDRILGALLDTDFSLATFENQPKGETSTPDARIRTCHGIWIETKTSRDAVWADQISEHLNALRSGEQLLLLTPDSSKPLLEEIVEADRNKVVWSNFVTLADAIEDILKDEKETPFEREAFLLREFVSMLHEDGLLDPPGVLVVAARDAWPMYKHTPLSAYISHPRTFRPSSHIAFYADGAIQPLVPKIEMTVDKVQLTQDGISHLELEEGQKARAKELLEELLPKIKADPKYNGFHGFTAKVLFLSAPNDGETVKLPQAIVNDKKDKSKTRRVPFTFGAPVYVTLESLKKACKTSDL